MPELDVSNVSIAFAVIGFHIVIIGLASYTLKERLYISDALIALVVGIVTGPIALNWVNDHKWSDSDETRREITYQVTRLVLGVQVLFCGISLPKAYLWRERLSLLVLLLPVMTAAWFSSALLIWALIPNTTFLSALLISGCITPTDPVLSNSIVKGRFAEKHVEPHVRNIIIAEAGANDGLGFPFVFMAFYLFRRHHVSGAVTGGPVETVGHAVGMWALDIIVYQIILGCALGAIAGYIARKTLREAEKRRMIDKDNFLAYGFGLALFLLGVVGILGSDDILCCFIAGNSFTWDDWFRVQTEDEGFQDVLDNLINAATFIYVGTLLPWHEFGSPEIPLSAWRLIVLGILVMLLRRLPWVMLLSRWVPALKTHREAAFSGYFGPIGIGAVYYAMVVLNRLHEGDAIDDDARHIERVLPAVVYFLVLVSVLTHGVTIAVAKLATFTRTITNNSTFPPGRGSQSQTKMDLPITSGDQKSHDVEAQDETAVGTPTHGVGPSGTKRSISPASPSTSKQHHAPSEEGTDAFEPNRKEDMIQVWQEGTHQIVEDETGNLRKEVQSTN